jgi:hypothetical protein
MGSLDKLFYEAPSIIVVEMAQEGVVCASGTETNGSPIFNGFNNEQEW